MHVRIYQPAKSAMQSGRGKTHVWVVEPELVTARTPDRLMGWVGAGDTMAELANRLKFETLDEAISFVQRQGWAFEVVEPAVRRIPPKNYLDNFRAVRPQDDDKAASGKSA